MRLIQGSAYDIPLPDKSVQLIVTSPPYFGLRTYGESQDEIGRESLKDYLNSMYAVGKELKRVIKDDGAIVWNHGDTASGSGGAGGDYNKGGRKEGKVGYKQGDSFVSKGSWCIVPHRVAIDWVDNLGLLLRSDITWDKGTVRPENTVHVKRPLLQTERIFIFSKKVGIKWNGINGPGYTPTDLWSFSPARGISGSPAPFPEELPRRAIELMTDEGDFVLDPFAGGGTTMKVADTMGRIGIGIELYGNKFLC